MTSTTGKRKLIEVSIPLEAINEQSAREKSIRHGHPSTLHLWWARRPLAAARSVLFAQLVDDPSSYEDEYADEAVEQGLTGDDVANYVSDRVDTERARLHELMTKLANWDNLNDEALWESAREEIRRSTGGNPPPIVDPFAGGGAIPLEAQRLGLEAHASDLNPVAVLINRAMIDIPPRFAGMPPVHPDADSRMLGWKGATGLAEDVRKYGAWIRDRAEERIGHLYPKARLADGSEAPVIAWIWARTVTCPNPACGIEMPLVRSWWLGKKKGKEAYVVPSVVDGRVEFGIGHDPAQAPTKDNDGTVGRQGATCVSCLGPVSLEYVREQSRSNGLGAALMATVAEGKRTRTYLAPTSEHIAAAAVDKPRSVPQGELFDWPGRINVYRYGLTKFSDLFTNRQLVALTTFSDLVGEAREAVLADALRAGMEEGAPLTDGGTGALAYAEAVATFLGMAVSRLTSTNSSLCRWNSATSKESVSDTFGRQALPMTWDYAEGSIFTKGPCELAWSCDWVAKALVRLPASSCGEVAQADAATRGYDRFLVSTDPPYYDNIGYSDLSDFFYVWLRRMLRSAHPDLFGTMLVPKSDELVANPYRHDGKEGAQKFFENGFSSVFAHARASALSDYPVAVFYAFKQSDVEQSGTASTGWETLLEGMVRNNWQVTGTWPMRSERGGRMISIGTNALASSIVLALRPRPENAGMIDKRRFRDELLEELPEKIREMQKGTIAPVDMAQAAIGPGMAIYSKYDRVLEADGSSLTVRQALQMINAVLDEVLGEPESDFDSPTRWCLKWFASHGFSTGLYGTAETLASATNVSVAGLARSGAVESKAGKVRLLGPDDLQPGYRPDKDAHLTLWEVTLQAAVALERHGIEASGRILALAEDRLDLSTVKELAFRAFALAEKNKDSGTAQIFNLLATSWPELTESAARQSDAAKEEGQGLLDLEGTEF